MKNLFTLNIIAITLLSACTSQSEYHTNAESPNENKTSSEIVTAAPQSAKTNSVVFINTKNPTTGNNQLSNNEKHYPSFLSIINSALEYNSNVSSLPSVVEQRKAEAEITRKNNWPAIQPVARYSNQVKPYIGVNASYTLWDFGSAQHKEKQSEFAVDNSQLDLLIEEREVIASTLESLVKISSLMEKKEVLSSAIRSISNLSKLADVRFDAGMASISESNTLGLRLSELQSDLDAMNIEINLNIDLLSSKLMQPISLADIPRLSNILSELLPDFGTESLQLRQAEVNKEIAYAQYEQAKSDIYPHLAVESELGKATSGDTVKNLGVSLRLPTSIFSRDATVNAAQAAYQSADRKVAQIQTQLDTENKRIMLEANRLNNNRNTLATLEKKGLSAIKVFDTEFEVGSASLSDGLAAHRTLLQTRQQLISIQAELLNLQASKIRITNGPIFNTSEYTK